MDHDGIGDACDDDIDGDGLTNTQETVFGTNPRNPDTDGDGLTDGQEVNVYHTDPNVSNKGDLAPRGAPDGQVNVADLLRLTCLVLGQDAPTAQEQILGDMNSDGVLDIRDLLILRRRLGF